MCSHFSLNKRDTLTKDLQLRLEEAEEVSNRKAKKQMFKLDQKVRELENALDGEQRKTADSTKIQRRLERQLKEVIYTTDEDQKAMHSWGRILEIKFLMTPFFSLLL